MPKKHRGSRRRPNSRRRTAHPRTLRRRASSAFPMLGRFEAASVAATRPLRTTTRRVTAGMGCPTTTKPSPMRNTPRIAPIVLMMTHVQRARATSTTAPTLPRTAIRRRSDPLPLPHLSSRVATLGANALPRSHVVANAHILETHSDEDDIFEEYSRTLWKSLASGGLNASPSPGAFPPIDPTVVCPESLSSLRRVEIGDCPGWWRAHKRGIFSLGRFCVSGRCLASLHRPELLHTLSFTGLRRMSKAALVRHLSKLRNLRVLTLRFPAHRRR
mmetsp:Transcript_2905/g.9039  ORF Transcript_2905/g.9039 Transcript_2905/m.9039 type:complete len:273 (-) Transcript_2905:547-1365(-)